MSKSILETIEGLNQVIRSLQKIEAKQRNGQFIDAHRAVNSLIAELNNNKKALMGSETVAEPPAE